MSLPVLLFDMPVLEAAADVAIDNPELIPRLLEANGRDILDVGESRRYFTLLKELADSHARGERPDREVLASRIAEASGATRQDIRTMLEAMHARANPPAFPLFLARLHELKIRRRLASLGEHAQNGHGFTDLLAEVRSIATGATGPGADLFEEIDVRKALREGVPPIKYDLAPYLASGTLTLISGPPKSAKTWMALAWSICLVTGRSFCDLTPQGEHRVLFVEAEYPRQIIIRCGELCRALQVNPETALERIRFIRPRRRLQIEEPAQAAALVSAAQEFGATVVVIDSLRRVHSLDENNSRDMANLADGALLPLRGNDERTILVIDHDAKAWMMGSRPKSQQLRGSGDKLASCDVLLHVEKHEPEGEARRYELTVAASRVADEDIESLWLQIHPTKNGGILVDRGEPVEEEKRGRRGRTPTQHEQAVNVIRAERGRNPNLKFADAIKAVTAAGPSEATAARAWRKCQLSEVSKPILTPDTTVEGRPGVKGVTPPIGGDT